LALADRNLRTQSSRVGKVLSTSSALGLFATKSVSEFTVAKHQYALRELSDIVLMRHKNNRQSFIIQPLQHHQNGTQLVSPQRRSHETRVIQSTGLFYIELLTNVKNLNHG
jgi:hypothetical protein